jgi:hypothetical protein
MTSLTATQQYVGNWGRTGHRGARMPRTGLTLTVLRRPRQVRARPEALPPNPGEHVCQSNRQRRKSLPCEERGRARASRSPGRVPVSPSIGLGGLDQGIDLAQHQVLPGADLGVGTPPTVRKPETAGESICRGRLGIRDRLRLLKSGRRGGGRPHSVTEARICGSGDGSQTMPRVVTIPTVAPADFPHSAFG